MYTSGIKPQISTCSEFDDDLDYHLLDLDTILGDTPILLQEINPETKAYYEKMLKIPLEENVESLMAMDVKINESDIFEDNIYYITYSNIPDTTSQSLLNSSKGQASNNDQTHYSQVLLPGFSSTDNLASGSPVQTINNKKAITRKSISSVQYSDYLKCNYQFSNETIDTTSLALQLWGRTDTATQQSKGVGIHVNSSYSNSNTCIDHDDYLRFRAGLCNVPDASDLYTKRRS